jgi:hypothetical protein
MNIYKKDNVKIKTIAVISMNGLKQVYIIYLIIKYLYAIKKVPKILINFTSNLGDLLFLEKFNILEKNKISTVV